MDRRRRWRWIAAWVCLTALQPALAEQTVIEVPLSGATAAPPQFAPNPYSARTGEMRRHIEVGATRTIKLPSQAALIANPGDII